MTEILAQRLSGVLESGVDVRRRRIYICGAINSKVAKRLQMTLDVLDDTPQKKSVEVLISSEGGDELAGMAMYEALRRCESPIVTIGVGVVMSMAVLVFEAGDKRFLGPETRLMVHGGTCNFGNADVLQSQVISMAKEMQASTKIYADLIASRTGGKLKASAVLAMCGEDDLYIDADTALQMGLADEILMYRPRPAPKATYSRGVRAISMRRKDG